MINFLKLIIRLIIQLSGTPRFRYIVRLRLFIFFLLRHRAEVLSGTSFRSLFLLSSVQLFASLLIAGFVVIVNVSVKYQTSDPYSERKTFVQSKVSD